MSKNDPAISILIVDDHTMFREGLKSMLSGQAEFKVVGEAGDGTDVCMLVDTLQPDILLLDLFMPRVGGMDVLRSLASSKSRVKTILLSGMVESDDVARIFELGARGLVTKDCSTALLFKSIRAVMGGQYWIGRESVASLIETLKLHKKAAKKAPPKNYGLTPREMEIVKAAVSGCSNKEIAAQFKISEQTVKHHITNIFDKLGVYNRLELTLFVFHHGLLDQS